MYRFKSTPQNLPELFIDALNLFGHGLREVWLWALLAAGVGMLSPRLVIDGYELVGGKVHWSYSWLMLLIVFAGSLPAAYIVGVMTRRLFLMGADRDEPIRETLALVFRKFPQVYFGLLIVSALSILGWLLVYIPGIFLSIVFVYTMPLILLDDYSIFGALKQSWRLVVDNWWRTFTMLLFPLMMFIMTILIPYSDQYETANALFEALVMWFAMPMMLSFMLTIFYDSKLRHNVPLHLHDTPNKSKPTSSSSDPDRSEGKVTARSKVSDETTSKTRRTPGGARSRASAKERLAKATSRRRKDKDS